MRIPGIENLRAEEEVPGVPAPAVPVTPDEAADIETEMTEKIQEQQQLMQALETLLTIDAIIAKEGVTPTMKAAFGVALADAGIDLEGSTEGIIDGIKSAIVSIRNAMAKASLWITDKFKALVDAQYEGLKELTKWSKSSSKILADADEEKVGAKTVRAKSREELMKLNAAAQVATKSAKEIFGTVGEMKSGKLKEVIEGLGGKVVTMRSATLNIDTSVTLQLGNTIFSSPIRSKSIKDLGFTKKTIKSDVDAVLKTLEGFVGSYTVWNHLVDGYNTANEKLTLGLAKGEDKDKLVELKHAIARHSQGIHVILDYSSACYQANRQLSLQMQRVANAFGKAD